MQIICINNVFLNNFINLTFCSVFFGAGSFLEVEAYSTLKHKKIDQIYIILMYFIVLRISCVFYCFFICMYFIVL